MRCDPDARWRLVLRAEAEPSNAIDAACWRHVKRHEDNLEMERAIEIFKEPFERERFQPWLLAGATEEDINARVGVNVQTTKNYKHLFFDVTVFRDELEKQLWVAKYEGSPEGMAYLQKAVLHGVEAVAHVMGAVCTLDPNTVIEQSMKDAYFRSQALRGAKLSSPEINMAHSLMKTAIEHAQLLSKHKPANLHDIMLRLKNRELTHTADDIASIAEILH